MIEGARKMPIYEYRCMECGESFEKLVRSMNATLEVKCPKCNAVKIKKLLSTFGVGTSESASQPICPTCIPRK
jgi:putative FmdB family regulatory protein